MRNPIIFSLLLIIFFLSACTPASKFPLSQPGEQANDERLLGVWLFLGEKTSETPKEDDGRIFIHISKDKEGWLEGVLVGPKGDDGGLGLITFQALTTQIGENHFVNIRNYRDFKKGATGPPGQPEPEGGLYWIVFYEISEEGRLFLREMNYEYVKKSIKAGRVEGSEAKEEFSITLTGNPENLIQFIKESDMDKLFQESKQFPAGKFLWKKLIAPPPPKSE